MAEESSQVVMSGKIPGRLQSITETGHRIIDMARPGTTNVLRGVAQGIENTDAINLEQLNAALANALGNRVVIASPDGLGIQAAYDKAKLEFSPAFADHAYVIVMPGEYEEDLTFDTNYISVLSLVHLPLYIYKSAVLTYVSMYSAAINAGRVRITGDVSISSVVSTFYGLSVDGTIDLLGSTQNIFDSIYATTITNSGDITISDFFYNCLTANAFLGEEVTFSGTMISCGGGTGSFFNGATSVVSGTMIDCIIGGSGSIASEGGEISGDVVNCSTTGSGLVTECIAGGVTAAGTISGNVLGCSGNLQNAYAGTATGTSGTISGTIKDCDSIRQGCMRNATLTTTGLVEDGSFLVTTGKASAKSTFFNQGTIEGTCRRIIAQNDSFGGNGGTIAATAVFENCESVDVNGWAYLSASGMAGTMIRCITPSSMTTPRNAVTVANGAVLRDCIFPDTANASPSVGGSGTVIIEDCVLSTGVADGIIGTNTFANNIYPGVNHQTSGETTSGIIQETLISHTIPKNMIWENGRKVVVTVWGELEANANSKEIELNFGAGSIQPTVTTTQSGGYIYMTIEATRISNAVVHAKCTAITKADSATLAATQEEALVTSNEDYTADIDVELLATTSVQAGDLTIRSFTVQLR